MLLLSIIIFVACCGLGWVITYTFSLHTQAMLHVKSLLSCILSVRNNLCLLMLYLCQFNEFMCVCVWGGGGGLLYKF